MADQQPQSSRMGELEQKASRITDPTLDYKAKHAAVVEFREALDSVRDTDAAHVLPQMVPSILDSLRQGQLTFQKESIEYQYRRGLVDILHRVPYSVDAIRPQGAAIGTCMLYLLRHDNEENGVVCSKIILDLVRGRLMSEPLINDFISAFRDCVAGIGSLVEEYLGDNPKPVDPGHSLPSSRSFKTLSEMSLIMVIISQIHRNVVAPTLRSTQDPAMLFLELESPTQKRAREEVEAMGSFWSGMASGIVNVSMYTDFLMAQVKIVSYMTYVMRWSGEQAEVYGDPLTLASLRILQDLPANNVALRRDIMVVFRYLMSSNHRQVLSPQMDKLYNERVVLGTGLTSRETMRPTVFSAVADYVHHMRDELSTEQIARVVQVYSRLLHNPSMANNLHTLFAKMVFNLFDTIMAKETSQSAVKTLLAIMEVCVARLETLAFVLQQVSSTIELSKKGEADPMDTTLIEKARPIGGAVFATEKGEDVVNDSRLIFRTMLHGFRVGLGHLKRCTDGRADLDGTLVFRLFDSCVRVMAHLELDGRSDEANGINEWFAGALLELNLHSFQEMWTHKVDLFFQCAQRRINLLTICNHLFMRESCSPTLLAIILDYLIDRLPQLGEHDELTAAVALRLYKMAFAAVTTFPAHNEPILASHIGKLLMDCFPLAAKATRPVHYFHLLRTLFRAIGSGGGRFELLYKEVLPLLPEMLENLNRHLQTTEAISRELIVELCLTVPLRLTHLLPHLTYLMRPLVLALQGSAELVSQGLRTLELCIDNLNADFLDPTLSTVLPELMDALHQLLKPLPGNHIHSHTTARILGKLGGRNRRLLTRELSLDYSSIQSPPTFPILLEGSPTGLDIAPVCALARSVIKTGVLPDRLNAYQYLESCIAFLLNEAGSTDGIEKCLGDCWQGIFEALHVPELEEQAAQLIRGLAKIIFNPEPRPQAKNEPFRNLNLETLLDGLAQSLIQDRIERFNRSKAIVQEIVKNHIAYGPSGARSQQELIGTLRRMMQKFSALCLEDSWFAKRAGCCGLKTMLDTPEFGCRWVVERVVDAVRTLNHVLKDVAPEQSQNNNEVLELLQRVIKISDAETRKEAPARMQNLLYSLSGLFLFELSNANVVVRTAVQECITLLSELSGQTRHELLSKHRDRALQNLYQKPLRALPISIQIGIIEAIRYCICLEPPLVEPNEELLRLLHESLALADAEDASLLGRNNVRQSTAEVGKLRVACIKLLTASMPLTDFFAKQPQTRQRVTGVYFKSLYSTASDVKNVAHDGLKMVLTHQSRLPKELLQTGLRPILMNLADPKRLSVSGLEGLARLLELLTSYFKVEIGTKLLDHFRILADAQLLQASARLPLKDNEGINKLSRLANIFHLLPPAAHQFLPDLVNVIVQTEATMHFSGPSPFSEPLARFLDRYPVDGAAYLIKNMNLPRYLRTLRSILQARMAPKLAHELVSRTDQLVKTCLRSTDSGLTMACLQLFTDLIDIDPSWLIQNPLVIEAICDIWRSEQLPPVESAVLSMDSIHKHTTILDIFMKALKQSPRIDLLFDIISIYNRHLAIDTVQITHFLYHHIALSTNLIFRRNILMRFLTWFENSSAVWVEKAHFIRYIITPTLLCHASKGTGNSGLIDGDFIQRIRRMIWLPMLENIGFSETDDMVKIELLHLTTVLVQHYPGFLDQARKDIIKCANNYIDGAEDTIVKQTALLLSARFFVSFPCPQKFVIHSWNALLRPPPSEGRLVLRQEALTTIASILPRGDSGDYPEWAKCTRRLLTEDGYSPVITIYQLIVKHPDLFYAVRDRFVPHIANNLARLGLNSNATPDSRLLTLDALQVMFDWDQKAEAEKKDAMDVDDEKGTRPEPWTTPIGFREGMVSFLVRLASQTLDAGAKALLLPRSLQLLKMMVAPNGWVDVTVGLRFFSKFLDHNELNNEATLSQATAAAKVVEVLAADQSDDWYLSNCGVLHRLVRKGLLTEDTTLHEALHPIFHRLVRLFPLPKEDDENAQHEEIGDFHSFITTNILKGLRDGVSQTGTILMLKSVVEVTPERVEIFGSPLSKLLGKLARDHLQSAPSAQGYEANAKLLASILTTCVPTIVHLSVEARKVVVHSLGYLGEKSKSTLILRCVLDIGTDWIFHHQDLYPTMKEKAQLISRLAALESRNDSIYSQYLELILKIYSDPSFRRSELTHRIESSFLLGCRAKDTLIRERFLEMYDSSIQRSLMGRLTFILGVQSWECLADQNWIPIALYLLLGATNLDAPLLLEKKNSGIDSASALASRQKSANVVRPLQKLLSCDPLIAHHYWVSLFSRAWECLGRREQSDLTLHMITLLSKEHHIKQAEARPNVIQTLLAGIQACSPPMLLPPHLIKYLAKTFGAWHVGLEILTTSLESARDDDTSVRDYVYDSLAELYGDLSETDMFYGLWRRRCVLPDTNSAIAFEQNGMWDQACAAYEVAQSKAKNGIIPFSEAEYCLWEDHWVEAAQKLQQWDSLYELGKSEQDVSLMLEAAWACKNWTEERDAIEPLIAQLPDVATPRHLVFQAFNSLLKAPAPLEKNVEFQKIHDEALQLALRKWAALPSPLSAAHVPLLQHFQQLVELQEAVQIFGSLSTTNAQNLEKKSSELKMVMQTWRDRLPNKHDDISVWSDLVAWRQNVFHAINKVYVPLIPTNQAQGANSTTSTYGYRGYHETAWIINRFAHVARKHDLLDVCFTQLNKIYTLPNIEISEAFLKLREQARCHYQKPNDLQAGMEVINSTNLMYFSTSQKAEFFTLKGMFFARFGRKEEANEAFSHAVQLDISQAKAWSEWGKFHDHLFQEQPTELQHAANALRCYFNAVGGYKNGKCRPLLVRILWLLSIDDTSYTVARAFDTYSGDAAFWFWIPLIPQLCVSISQREWKQARHILLNLAKLYPQALFYHLRLTREDNFAARKAAAMYAARNPSAAGHPTTNGSPHVNHTSAEQTGDHQPVNGAQQHILDHSVRQPAEHIEEVVQILKTAFPLLTLAMETMVDQIQLKFKASFDEEVYRHICLLMHEAVAQFVVRVNEADFTGERPIQIMQNLTRITQSLPVGSPIRHECEEELLKPTLSMEEYIFRLQGWRDRFERTLDSRPTSQALDTLSHYLTEFQYGKVDEIEVPGQYSEDRDNNQNFVKIQKFVPRFENVRLNGNAWKRITLRGSDSTRTSFLVQLPLNTVRHWRRDERTMQLLRTWNGTLQRRKETRRRNLSIHVPITVACSGILRLYQNDASYVNLGDILDAYSASNKISREQPVLAAGKKVMQVLKDFRQTYERQPSKAEYVSLRKEIFDEIVAKYVPEDILTNHMIRTMATPSDLWRMRKQFTLQLAACSFSTYVLCLSYRYPSRFSVSCATGLVTMLDLIPGIAQPPPGTTGPTVFSTTDVVPFRFTPNLQHFVTPIGMEGLLPAGLMAIGRSLTEPMFDLDQQLALFGRDEVHTIAQSKPKEPRPTEQDLYNQVKFLLDGVVKRAEVAACKVERDQALTGSPGSGVVVMQTAINLISSATNPLQLTKMGDMYTPWF